MSSFLKTTQIAIHGARTLPGRYYTSPEIFADEAERIFARRWLCVGREDRIPAPGDYVLQAVGPDSVILLRDRDGAVRAFHNVCRHRGTQLCEAPAGKFPETIQCPYHAWTYALDGRLVGVPSLSDLDVFDKADYSLHRVAVERWEGFLFLHLTGESDPLSDTLGSLLDRVARFNLPSLISMRTIEYDVHANWKLLFQNYSECYHCGPIHPPLARLSPPTSGENDLVEGPVLGGFMAINERHESLSLSGRACGIPVGTLPEEDRHRVYYYSIFPNMLLSLHPDYVMFHRLWPQAPGRTRVVCEWLFHPDTPDHPEFDPSDGIDFWDMTNRQDWHICEQGQLGIMSRAYRPGPYSRRESLSALFDREVLQALGHTAATD